jgi:hypothetical protein
MSVEIIFNAPDIPTLAAAAAQMGYWDAQKQQVIQTGPIFGGGGYFYNFVGTVYTPTGETTTDAFGNTVPVMAAQPGVWGRLRHNGDPAYMPQLPANSGITLYRYDTTLGGWTSDGVTLAPDWVSNVAVIA